MTNIKSILYVHGLGGSPESAKAQLIRRHFEPQRVLVESPSVSLPTLHELSPMAASDFLAERLEVLAAQPMALMASSFGAFLSLHAVAKASRTPALLVLLAPVIDPWHKQSALLSPQMEREWCRRGAWPVTDLTRNVEIPVHYRCVEELHRMGPGRDSVGIPTLIIHGRQDKVVSIEQAMNYAQRNNMVEVFVVDDDHALLKDPGRWLGEIDRFVSTHAAQGG